jgi:hypothetical protein
LSSPSPQTSLGESFVQAQALREAPVVVVQAQLAAGQSASASQLKEQTAPAAPVSVTQSPEAQSSAC